MSSAACSTSSRSSRTSATSTRPSPSAPEDAAGTGPPAARSRWRSCRSRSPSLCRSRSFFFISILFSPLYELPFSLDPLAPRFLASAAATVSITALAWILRERFPAVLAAWAAYLIALLPVLGVGQYGPHIAADRNTYLASVPLAAAAGAAFLWLWRQPAPRRLFARATLVTAAAALLVILSALTWRQTAVWRGSRSLWARVLAVGPSAIAHSKLGIIRDEQGELAEALSHFRMALDIQPGLAPAHNNWGIAL